MAKKTGNNPHPNVKVRIDGKASQLCSDLRDEKVRSLGITSVAAWGRVKHFRSEEEARGAIRLAYQQGYDGLGPSVEGWMGFTREEFNAWVTSDKVPKRFHGGPKKYRCKTCAELRSWESAECPRCTTEAYLASKGIDLTELLAKSATTKRRTAKKASE